MEQQSPLDFGNQASGLQYNHKNLLDDLEKFRHLNEAVERGQERTVELLLSRGAPVNRHPITSKLRTPLHSSVHVGNLEIVKQLLKNGASVNARYSGDTPLTLATKFEKYEIADLLLQEPKLENCSSDEGITHLHIACLRGQADIAKKLVQVSQDVHAKVHLDSDYWPGFTPLHFAVQFQCLKVVEFLLSVGADITIKDARQLTPLHLANMLRNLRIMDMIISTHGKILSNPVNSKGLSHFHIACTRNKPEIVRHFLRLGVNIEDKIEDQITENSFHWKNRTAIDLAIYHECADVVELLLQNGARVRPEIKIGLRGVNQFDRMREAYCTRNTRIIGLLTTDRKSYGESEHIQIASKYLASLIQNNVLEFKSLLYQSPSDLNVPIILNGSTLLHLAIEHRNRELGEFLLNRGADFTIQDAQGKSPLHLAFELNMQSLVNSMLENHRNVHRNPTNKDGLSHLHIASARNDPDFVEHLLKLEFDVNSQVNSDALCCPEFTPLHFAAKFGSEKAADMLLKYGASYSVTDAAGLSAFDVALMEVHNKRATIERFSVIKEILKCRDRRKNDPLNDRGVTLLHVAGVRTGFSDSNAIIASMTEYLEAHPDDLNKTVHKMNTVWDGFTPLHLTLYEHGQSNCAQFLIEKGADLLKQASNGDTPLHLLLSNVAIPVTRLDSQDLRLLELNHIGSKGFSIFHCACKQGNLELMKFFLEHGVDPNYPSLNDGLGCHENTPIQLAIYDECKSCVAAVRLLLDHGADPNIRDYRYDTSLHYMAQSIHSDELIDLLISHGADVEARNAFQETPLISVCADPYSHADNLNRDIMSLLNNGADINAVDERGMTALSIKNISDLHPGDLDDFGDFSPVIGTLLKHVIKLKTLGFYVKEINKMVYTTLLQRFSRELDFNEATFTEQCKSELELMKQIRTFHRTTLYSILFENFSKVAVTSQNVSFRQIINSNNFQEKFPNYGFMLNVQLREGQIRWALLNLARDSLDILLNTSLPRVCGEEIMQYLDNQDLENIIEAKKKL